MTLSVCLWMTLLSTVTVCSSSLNFEPRSSIVGGEDATPGRWPWMVFLAISNGTHNFKCGGSLINNHWVLTAAHCLVLNVGKPNLLLSYARLGVLKLADTKTGKYLHFHLFLIHPEYNVIYGAPLNDIALMRLKKPVPISYTVAPVILPGPRDVFTLNSECWVTGWGHIAEKRPLGGDQTLQQVKLPLVDNYICKKAYPETNNKQLCAGFLEGGKDSCQGDSGGPLVCKSFGMFVQVGVVSFGHGCGRYGYPGVYTRVYNYIQFIEDTIRKYR